VQLQAQTHAAILLPVLFPPEYVEARARYRAFMREHLYPNETAIEREDDASLELIASLQARAREAGLWAPHVPPGAGGTGKGFLYYACVNEEIGRSLYAQLVFGCQAPDAGNAEILHQFGTEQQKRTFLRPLVAGRGQVLLRDDRARGIGLRSNQPACARGPGS
jgi:acyl-CoA dehydrogenase